MEAVVEVEAVEAVEVAEAAAMIAAKAALGAEGEHAVAELQAAARDKAAQFGLRCERGGGVL